MSGWRSCLRWIGLWALLFLAPAPAQQAPRALTILHINDLHARLLPDGRQQGGFAHLATVIRRERSGCDSCLLLNGGDLVQGSPVSTLFRGLPVFEVANRLGFDAFTLGNHEFDYGWQMIPEFVRKARFPVISANVEDAGGRLLAPRAYLIRTVNGIRVALIGALTADLPDLSMPDLLGPWRASPVVEAVKRSAAEVRDRSDLVVVVAHINPQEEDQILRQVPEVAVVVSGHVHRGLESPKSVDGRVAVRAKAYGEELGRLDLQLDPAARKLVSFSWKRIPIDARTIPPAPDVARLVKRWEAKVSKIVDVTIGEARREFAGKDLEILIEKAMAEETGADLAFMNTGGIRDFLPRGRLLARHVWNVMPFDNRIVVGRFKGSKLPQLITEGASIDPDREYTLAVNDFTAANQGVELHVEGLQFSTTGPLHRDLMISWIKKKKVLE